MNITKSGMAEGGKTDIAEELRAVNAFARTELTEEEVYIFPVKLCDNEVDRDFERFSESALAELRELFVGRTGIADHNWSSAMQKARIYRTELVKGEGTNSLGAPYVYLKGWVYMLRSPENAELIAEIEAGIKKETSVGCSVAKSVCSICGEDIGGAACSHIRGREYGGKLCYAELTGAVDAYEWSFVAVPAQRGAGVIKRFADGGGSPDAELEKMAEIGRRYLNGLRGEVLRLGLLWDEEAAGALKPGVECLGEAELLSLKAAFEGKLKGKFPPVTQLPGRNDIARFDGAEFLV